MRIYKAYILTFDRKFLEPFNYKAFHDAVVGYDEIISWWHYLQSTYILIVDGGIEASDITQFVLSIAPGKNFFVCELSLSNHNGFLPKEAWEWINKFLDARN